LLVGETAILVGTAREVNCSVRGCQSGGLSQAGENAQKGNFRHVRHIAAGTCRLKGSPLAARAAGWLISAR